MKNVPTDAQVADAAKTLAQAGEAWGKVIHAEQHIHSLKYILRLEARAKELEAR